MIHYKCDRCGEPVEKGGRRLYLSMVNGSFTIIRLNHKQDPEPGIDPADLCKSCAQGLLAWLRREAA